MARSQKYQTLRWVCDANKKDIHFMMEVRLLLVYTTVYLPSWSGLPPARPPCV